MNFFHRSRNAPAKFGRCDRAFKARSHWPNFAGAFLERWGGGGFVRISSTFVTAHKTGGEKKKIENTGVVLAVHR